MSEDPPLQTRKPDPAEDQRGSVRDGGPAAPDQPPADSGLPASAASEPPVAGGGGDAGGDPGRTPADDVPPVVAAAGGAAGDVFSEPALSSWVELVQPYLAKLAEHLHQQGVKSHTISLPVGAERLLVTPLEQNLVTVDAASPPLGRSEELIRDGVGLKVKILADLRNDSRTADTAKGQVRHELRRDVEAAQLLAYELHRQAAELSRAGEFERARQCAEYRRVLLTTADRAAVVIGGAGDLAAMPAGAVITTAAERGGVVHDSVADAARHRRIVSRPDHRAAAAHRLKIVLAALLPLLLVVLLVRLWLQRPRELEHFSTTDLRKVPGIEMVVHREPDFVVVVSVSTWRGLSENQKRAAMQSAVDLVQRVGYRGVEFRSSSGETLSTWTKGAKITIR